MTMLTYNGQPIALSGEMLNLTDMWRAAGADDAKRPANWARKEGREFIAHVGDILNMPQGHIQTKRGAGGSTVAHWHIGLAYAKYLSPDFHVWCNTVVRDRMERRGHFVPELTASSVGGIVKGIVHKALAHYLETEIPRLVEARLAVDPRVAVVDRRSAKEVLDGLKVPSKGRRGLVGRVSYALRSACLRDGEVALRCARTRTWLYPEPLIQRWLNGGGLASVREWQAQKRGELRLFDFGRKGNVS